MWSTSGSTRSGRPWEADESDGTSQGSSRVPLALLWTLSWLRLGPYFSHIDRNGRASEPFVLPQEDPEFYDTFLYAYNVPELISGPVKVDPRRLVEAIRSPEAVQVDARTQATPNAQPQAPR
jgi:hypothetical protein